MPSRRYQDPLAIAVAMALLPTALLPPPLLQPPLLRCRFRRRTTPEQREAIPTMISNHRIPYGGDSGGGGSDPQKGEAARGITGCCSFCRWHLVSRIYSSRQLASIAGGEPKSDE